MAERKQGDELEPTYNSSVGIREVGLRTCQKRGTIERSGERVSGISVLVARQDDDIYIYIYMYVYNLFHRIIVYPFVFIHIIHF